MTALTQRTVARYFFWACVPAYAGMLVATQFGYQPGRLTLTCLIVLALHSVATQIGDLR